jgi:hypothetical protein
VSKHHSTSRAYKRPAVGAGWPGKGNIVHKQKETAPQPFTLADEGIFDRLASGKQYKSDNRAKLRNGLIGPMRQEIEQTPREQETAEQAKLQKYFEDYDRINRPKTLLEEHQEKNKERKEGSGRVAFDRESYGGTRASSPRMCFKWSAMPLLASHRSSLPANLKEVLCN